MAVKRAQVEDKAATATSTRYQVAEGTQVHHHGVTHQGGETIDLADDAALVAHWLHAGWITTA